MAKTTRTKTSKAAAAKEEDLLPPEPCANCGRKRPVRELLLLHGRYRCPERWDCKHPE